MKELSKSDDGWELYHPFQVDHQNKGASTNHRANLTAFRYRPVVCRDLRGDTCAKSRTPPKRSCFPKQTPKNNGVDSAQSKNNHKRAQNRRVWRFCTRMFGKPKRPQKAQEAWQERKKNNRTRGAFKEFKGKASQAIDPHTREHKSKGPKLPYGMPLKAATVNIRGLNGENGITKRQHIVRVMKEERLDILLTETQVNTSSVDTLDDYVLFFSSDIQPGKSDREHTDAGVGIVIHRRLKPFLSEIKQTSGRLMAMRLRSLGANMAHGPYLRLCPAQRSSS